MLNSSRCLLGPLRNHDRNTSMRSSLSRNLRRERSKTCAMGSCDTVSISPANTAHVTRSSRSAIRSMYSAVDSLKEEFIRISRNRSQRSAGGESSVMSTVSSSMCLAVSAMVDSNTWNDITLSRPPCRRDRATVVITCLGSPVPIRNAENGRSPGSGWLRS